jgi:hypothetical protein
MNENSNAARIEAQRKMDEAPAAYLEMGLHIADAIIHYREFTALRNMYGEPLPKPLLINHPFTR